MPKNRLKYTVFSIFTIFLTLAPLFAQSGGPFVVERTVVANGGVTSSSAGQFTLSGTIGQSVAGQPVTSFITTAQAGFWNQTDVASIPITFSVSGKITIPGGQGLRNATVTLTDQLRVVRTATTSSFGNYQFDNVDNGRTYTIRIISRLYRFEVRVITVMDNLTNIDLVGIE